MSKPYVTILGKAVRSFARLRGGGSALPGLFVERIDPTFVPRCLAQLPRGVVIVSGTNGKTTTTKMVASLLEAQGLRVFTNRTGSNFVRGVAAALLGEVDKQGNLNADIAVLELDEAHAIHFVAATKPKYSLLLNVMRDQLDRFGEIDYTASLLHTIAEATTEHIVLNIDDPRLGSTSFKKGLAASMSTFGVSASLLKDFPSDDALYGDSLDGTPPKPDVVLKAIHDQTASITYDGRSFTIPLQISGSYNMLNATAAVALCRAILGSELDEEKMITTLSQLTPAFGRGETLTIGGQPIQLVLVKNPSGFRLSLSSFSPEGHATMIAINDNYADGRDMSWLWDVPFRSFSHSGVHTISGIRAYDMALRLQYEEIDVGTVEPNLRLALRSFISSNPDTPKRVYCTYTAMLTLRKELAKMTKVEPVE